VTCRGGYTRRTDPGDQMSRLAFAILLIIISVALAGCGQKGPLVRPGSSPAAGHSAPAPASTSAVPDTADDGGR
ncbi:MAG: LPS translocon maturation chaperone LptM, partial [Rhodanobacteraceae bacterium]